jgi:hypothetical protein
MLEILGSKIHRRDHQRDEGCDQRGPLLVECHTKQRRDERPGTNGRHRDKSAALPQIFPMTNIGLLLMGFVGVRSSPVQLTDLRQQ